MKKPVPSPGTGGADRVIDLTQGDAARPGTLEGALAACAKGQEHGLEAVLALEGGRMLGIASRMLGRRDLAEEALQDSMVQIWRKATQFRAGNGSARGWVYAILRNRCRNILRDDARLSILSPPELTFLQEARQEIVREEGWEMLPGSTRLRDCLATLDPASREAILLAHVVGFSHGEISARQGVPLGTAKSWIRRGLSALRECLS
ncbi:MAG: sigma-70 family RNA polymerase sigma factor [Rhodobiaceae bacterium]|nr:sigma-70 family RNA polymerase sigma factor [Rhodobiaceae bacterium]MCC0054989.1 sigma-70 family RNA polymerase sigma factor [Rhodobiaceae bacterium]